MTLTLKLTAALASLLPYLHQEQAWLRGSLEDDPADWLIEASLEELAARVQRYEALIAEARS